MPSVEQMAIVSFVKYSGLPHRVTDYSTPGIHSKTSYHYANPPTAVDLAGRVPYGVNAKQADADMQAIYKLFEPLAKAGVLTELFYKNQLWKRGQRIVSAAITRAHMNHVHVACRAGWRFTPPTSEETSIQEIVLADDPNIPNIKGPIGFKFYTDPATGHCIGYHVYSLGTGEIHGWGPAAVYHGRSEVVA